MSQIFISYSNEDVGRARALAEKLSERGWSVWWDRKIPIGKHYDEVIEEKLNAARCVIVLWTSASVGSHWVKTEADEGQKRGVLVPVRMDRVEIPLGFRRMQAADLIDWDHRSDTQEVRDLIAAVAALVEGPGVAPRNGLEGGRPRDGVDAGAEGVGASPRSAPPVERSEVGPKAGGASGPRGRSWRTPAAVLVALLTSAGLTYLPKECASPAHGPGVPPVDTPRVAAGTAAATDTDMVVVPGGKFFMGCNEKVDDECDGDEKPGRTVEVAEFSIDRTEVTVAAYAACVAAKGCSAEGATEGDCNWGKEGREQHPMNCVDWEQARAYCAWKQKRLPTEAEWEKAARGTEGWKYPWGNPGYEAGGPVRANIADESAKKKYPGWTVAEGYDDGFVGTAPVGSFAAGASPYGALDMIGNVWEWVSDEIGDGRGLRGGSWVDQPWNARASNRYWSEPQYRSEFVGFRCAQ